MYYWDTNWYDQYERTHPNSSYYPGNIFSYSFNELPADVFLARPCVTDTPMLVRGIAGAMKIQKRIGSIVTITIDTTISGRLSEQFRLLDSNYSLLGEGCLDSVIPTYRMEFRALGHRDTFDIYEVYFKQPILVNGLFYVGGTTHNNLLYGYSPDYGWGSWAHPNTLYPFYRSELESISPYPPYILLRYESPYRSENPDTPTGWSGEYFDTVFSIMDAQRQFFPFFAIIDTNYVYYDCQKPTGFGVISADFDNVQISWSNCNAFQWDVYVWPEGLEPDSGMIFTAQSNSLTLHGLDIYLSWWPIKIFVTKL